MQEISQRAQIRLFGERNTGTRAVAAMLRPCPRLSAAPAAAESHDADLDALEQQIHDQVTGRWRRVYLDALADQRQLRRSNAAAWKHAAPVWDDSFARLTGVLFTVRDPYSWLVGLAQHPHHMAGRSCATLGEFINAPWLTQRRDRLDGVLASPVDLWVGKLAAYQRFAKQASIPTTVLHFERFVADPVVSLTGALADLGVAVQGLVALETSTKDGAPLAEIQSRHRTAKWRDFLTRGDVGALNARMDWAVANAFGYQALDPEQFPETLSPETAQALADVLKIDRQLHRKRGAAPAG